jgi:hypothetical protein
MYQVTDLAAAVDRLNQDKVNLECQMEMEEENIVNRLQRQLQGLVASYKNIEQKLEAKGISLRDVGVQPIDMHAEYAPAPQPAARPCILLALLPTGVIVVSTIDLECNMEGTCAQGACCVHGSHSIFECRTQKTSSTPWMLTVGLCAQAAALATSIPAGFPADDVT